MLSRGYATLGRIRGIPVRVQWTVALLFLMVGGLRFAPGAWVGALLIVLIHELGHAALARRFRLPVLAIEIHGLGGLCRYGGSPSAYQRAVIAWGGVLGQALLLAVALPLGLLGVLPRSVHVAELVSTLVSANLFIAAINLIPVAPLDGHEAWRLPGLWRRRRREKRDADDQRKKNERLLRAKRSNLRVVREGDEFRFVIEDKDEP